MKERQNEFKYEILCLTEFMSEEQLLKILYYIKEPIRLQFLGDPLKAVSILIMCYSFFSDSLFSFAPISSAAWDKVFTRVLGSAFGNPLLIFSTQLIISIKVI